MQSKKIIIDKANRLYQFPPEMLSFVQADDRRRILPRAELLDLARFSWPVERESVDFGQSDWLRPASSDQIKQLRIVVADWLTAQTGVSIHPEREIFIGGSISDLLFLLGLALIDQGDIAFVPELGIPLYRRIVTACGGQPISYSITRKTDWLPQFDSLKGHLGRIARLLYLNSPHNPTGAELTAGNMTELIRFASRENIAIINDAAHRSLSERSPVSLLGAKGGKKVGVEVYSFAYNFGLPSYPFGFVAGNREIIRAIAHASVLSKSHLPATMVDRANAAVRQYPSDGLINARKSIRQTAAASEELLTVLSLEKVGGSTVPFIWAEIRSRRNSIRAARILLRRNRILVAPGNGFGEPGQGYLRLSLTSPAASYHEAVSRLKGRRKRLMFMNDGEDE